MVRPSFRSTIHVGDQGYDPHTHVSSGSGHPDPGAGSVRADHPRNAQRADPRSAARTHHHRRPGARLADAVGAGLVRTVPRRRAPRCARRSRVSSHLASSSVAATARTWPSTSPMSASTSTTTARTSCVSSSRPDARSSCRSSSWRRAVPPLTTAPRSRRVAEQFHPGMELAEFRRLDRRFHALIARACGNPLLVELYGKVLARLFRLGGLRRAALGRRQPRPRSNGSSTSRPSITRRSPAAIAAGDVGAAGAPRASVTSTRSNRHPRPPRLIPPLDRLQDSCQHNSARDRGG